MKQCFAYLRVSSSGQVEKDGFQRQEKAISDYAKTNGIEIVDIYREDISGTKEIRPVLADLMVSLEENGHGIKTVIIEKLDRLARDLMIQEAIIRDFQSKGISLISALEGPDLCANDPTRKFIRQVMGAASEYDKTMLVAKLQAARERKKLKSGKCEGRKRYDETDQGKMILVSIETFKNKTDYTLEQMAHALNVNKLLTLDGKLWTTWRVHQIMKKYF